MNRFLNKPSKGRSFFESSIIPTEKGGWHIFIFAVGVVRDCCLTGDPATLKLDYYLLHLVT
jgi:hypothetical protein